MAIGEALTVLRWMLSTEGLAPFSLGVGALVVLAVFGVVGTLRMKAAGFFATTTAGATALLLAVGLTHRWVRLRVGVPYDPVLVSMLALAGATLSVMWLPLIAARKTLSKRTREEDQRAADARGLACGAHPLRLGEARSEPVVVQSNEDEETARPASRSLA